MRERDMNKKIFVGGLSWNTTSEGMLDAFVQFGAIEDARVITDRETGRGFGFVTFEDADSVSKAISGMDGQSWDGRTIKVSEAEEKPRGSRNNHRSHGNHL